MNAAIGCVIIVLIYNIQPLTVLRLGAHPTHKLLEVRAVLRQLQV